MEPLALPRLSHETSGGGNRDVVASWRVAGAGCGGCVGSGVEQTRSGAQGIRSSPTPSGVSAWRRGPRSTAREMHLMETFRWQATALSVNPYWRTATQPSKARASNARRRSVRLG